ncbi:Methyltransferase [Pyrodictium delaneyi]|uniref:Methyltransferase n=1 Tax=Pyrodictium delaneyi TaxID=1273541 RepID=A0A0N7JD00_9CREN|nr:class I SAM-dependent methyltransferase [Pyrodictium delaneyi]ALL00809.1 Methyltransferase [Pyrodictium delaneyi]OWJ55557.1 SAM-dependent methyltransferase [Pyrodictium delaneyi]
MAGEHLMYTVLAEYYDYIYARYLEQVPSIIDAVEELFRRHARGAVRRVLDLACGTGSPTLELARRGYSVTGVDLHGEVLKVARRKAEREGLRVELVQADMRELDLPRRDYDAATVFFSSIQYVGSYGELVGVLERIRAHLRPGGVLVFDAMNPLAVDASRQVVWDAPGPRGEHLFMVDYRDVDPFKQVMRFKRLIMVLDGRGGARTYLVDDEVYLYTPNEYRLALREAGFREAHLYQGYGDVNGEPNPRRIVAVATA